MVVSPPARCAADERLVKAMAKFGGGALAVVDCRPKVPLLSSSSSSYYYYSSSPSSSSSSFSPLAP